MSRCDGRLWWFFILCFAMAPPLGAAAETGAVGAAPPKPAAGQLGHNIPDWQARLELARLLSYLKKYDESVAEYAKVLREKPDAVEARAEMGQVLFWSGRRDEALKALEQVPPEKMDDQTRAVLADLYAAQKKYDRAEALYRAYLDKHPEDWGTRLKKGRGHPGIAPNPGGIGGLTALGRGMVSNRG
jgi:tetratricopeptide (TPR) repeat protein